MNANIIEAVKAFRTAEQKYRSAFDSCFASQVAALPMDRFWQLQAVLLQEVIRFRFGYGRTNGVEQAARELFRKPLAGDFQCVGEEPDVEYTLDEAVQFAKTWRQLRGRLHEPLFDVVDGRGDDAYGDLLDALPLAGRVVVEKALSREYAGNGQLERAVRQACRDCAQLAELVLHGENYVGMSLLEAARSYLAAAIAAGT